MRWTQTLLLFLAFLSDDAFRNAIYGQEKLGGVVKFHSFPILD